MKNQCYILGINDVFEDLMELEIYLENFIILQNFVISNDNWVEYFDIFLNLL